MIKLRAARERGRTVNDWLDSYHTFSFNQYHDPEHTHFRKLRVINEDRVAPGGGFGRHPHRDMEILTYVIEGALEHRDSLGTGSVIRPGSLQRMTAGSGLTHSEFNHSQSEPVHFLQIWIFPEQKNQKPSYQQISFARESLRDNLYLLASNRSENEVIHVNQDVQLYGAVLDAGRELAYDIRPERHLWIQIVRGEGSVSGMQVGAGDGLAVSREPHIKVVADSSMELLLFDLA